MNAADYYGLEELKRACFGFVQCCVTVDTVCALLATAERYIQYKCTKYLVQKVSNIGPSRMYHRCNFFYCLGLGICRWAWKWSSEFRLICSPTSTCCTLNSSSRWVESRWILQVPSKSPSCNLRHTFVVGKKYFSKELFKSLVSILVPTLNPDFRLHWCGARNIVTPMGRIYLKYSKDFWITSISIWSLLMSWWKKSIHWALFHIVSSWMRWPTKRIQLLWNLWNRQLLKR